MKKRATNDLDKLEKKTAIQKAALEFIEEHRYEDITMNALANKLNIAKGTLYLYFSTKESLFIDIYVQQVKNWCRYFKEGLELHKHEITKEKLTQIIVDAIRSQQNFPKLLSILHSTLEHNISLDQAISYKTEIKNEVQACAMMLKEYCPFFSEEEAFAYLFQLNAVIIGLWQMGHPPAVIRQAYEREELKALNINFYVELERVIHTYMTAFFERKLDA